MSRNDILKTNASDVAHHGTFDLEQYASQMKQLDSEALYTFIAAVVVTLVFWLSIYFTHDSSVTLLHLPLWFVLSCLGGYAFSVIAVIFLVKVCLKSMALKVPSYKHSDDGLTVANNKNNSI